MTILGIETSCDETSVGIVEKTGDNLIVKANVTATSLALHNKTGGIIPEIAAREQVKFILPVLQQALKEGLDYDLSPTNDQKLPDAIAVTYGPGLVGSLLVGIETAKTLSLLWDKPIIPVNHMWGHIYANFIGTTSLTTDEQRLTTTSFPTLVLVVSGGHTDLVLMKNHGDIQVIGGTRDDAAGECFDKCARMLGLPYPGGPEIARLAAKGNPKAIHFPRPLWSEKTYDFSFSGLKSAVFREVQKQKPTPTAKDQQLITDFAASIQAAIIDVLVKKTIAAAQEYGVKTILLSGGVAANDLLREQLQQTANGQRLAAVVFAPQKSLCTDNGAMIAAAAAFNFHPISWQDITVNPELYY